jgi:2-succinyl-5-enolpyruvyl-6-hydroxy-3-cyclohexene-1-carboxylate synthase
MRTTAHRVAAILVQTLAEHGLRDAVISPGSRNAPLVIALHLDPRIRITVATDERSAAHIALGMALATRRPAAAVTTSGTAAVNHGPALAEAFHARVPLISLTADRPVASRDRGHGQTARQAHLFAPHVLLSLDLDEHDLPAAAEAARRAIAASRHGPVHLNVPLSEPLYALEDDGGFAAGNQIEVEDGGFAAATRTAHPADAGTAPGSPAGPIDAQTAPTSNPNPNPNPNPNLNLNLAPNPNPNLAPNPNPNLNPNLVPQPQSHSPFPDLLCESPGMAVCVIVGALPPRTDGAWEDLGERLSQGAGVLAERWSVVCGEAVEASADRWVAAWGREFNGCGGVPDVVVTAGGPPMSRVLREAVTGWGVPHVHIGNDGPAWDVFGSLEAHWAVDPWEGLAELAEMLEPGGRFAGEWEVARVRMEAAHREAAEAAPWSDLQAVARLAEEVKEGEVVHAANSTSARYVQLFDWNAGRVHANRGVAGIDGCVSTAVGDALMHLDRLVWLLTGDLAMLYDSNGLLVSPFPSNLRIVVVNNGGGNIFRWLPGPAQVGLLEPYFEAGTGRSFAQVAALHGLEYLRAADDRSCADALAQLRTLGRPALLEVVTDGVESAAAYRAYATRCARLGGA